MRILKPILVIPLVLFLISMISINPTNQSVYACSCMQPLSPDEELPKFDTVFSGKVGEILGNQSLTESQKTDSMFATFDVYTIWKGDKKDTITVKTSQSSASCGFNFEENQEYVVYANQYEGEYLEVSLCSRTGLLSDALEEFDELGPGYSPKFETNKLLPPFKQLMSGVPSEKIQCNDGLYRALKHDNTPVCIAENSIVKLAERGWLNTELQEFCFDQVIDGKNVTTCS